MTSVVRIPLAYRDRPVFGPELADDHPEFYVDAVVEHQLARQMQFTEFIIDTGSPRSLLDPEVCGSMQLRTQKLEYSQNALLAANRIAVADLQDLTICLQDRDGDRHEFTVDILAADYAGTRNTPCPIDSIIGVRFLQQLGASLHIETDGHGGPEAWMEV